jgi:uncharacterized surface protein with fasciclin (FAS1) repeats
MKTNTIPKMMLVFAMAAATPMAFAQNDDKSDKKSGTEEKIPAPGSVASVIHDGVTFSILAKLVKAAELEETLSGKGPFTVFGATDEAFGKLPKGALDKLLLPENKEKLRTLVTYHVIAGQLVSADLKDGEVKTLSGDKVNIDVDGNGKKIEIDDSKVVSTDVVANNGIFHAIDKVLVPKSLDGFADLDHDD